MQPIINAPLSSLIFTLTLLCGWFISDFRINDAVNAIEYAMANNRTYAKVNVGMYPSTSTPNIDTNWISESNSRVSS